MGVTGGSLNGEDTTRNSQEGDIKGAATQIEDENILLLGVLGVETVGDGGGGGLVDDTKDLEPSNGTGVLGRLALGVVEVCGDGDDGLLDGLAKLGLGDLLHLDENHGRNLYRFRTRQNMVRKH
ncbi:NAD-specific glutamate dehydrogenase-domain-containing protein [Jimgerdemannia flammicorona]|uniref:NAD-specific glutamate dehydrogenase-domain-containing protein n=2 Tax=Jimgerdemannia flammicorona TaxID=994334 RepID=A0A433D8H6_9FUNG|nr:NAD-specific glutamate dehydrogenase-domain-containing protein [Jimgerdemannia flammicorona]RUS29339.1 NAD-specific glutamate dehydrogenase-domain-containing protein [Jimgerdemannia flammicorona]